MGSKMLTADLYAVQGYGHLVDSQGAAIITLTEEHAIVDLSACSEQPALGDAVIVIPNHCCVISNMVDEMHGVRGVGLKRPGLLPLAGQSGRRDHA
jgi:D-serine deaminase-like pyridoxal phosphate-dependent protein